MKINEFAIVDPKVDEAPQGILKRTGLGIAKAFGSDKAAGKLETGKMANLIKKAFNKHLGASGREANAEELIKFLKINKYPTAGVEKMAQDMANKEKAKTMQKGPMGGDDEEGEDNRIQFATPDEIKKSSGESVEEAELKGSQIDKLIMKAATDAYDVKAGYGGTGLGSLTGGNQGGDEKTISNKWKGLGVKNPNVADEAFKDLLAGKQLQGNKKQAAMQIATSLQKVLADPKAEQQLITLLRKYNK